MAASKIIKLEFLETCQIKIYLENNHCIIYNMQSKLETMRFHDLHDPQIFSQGKLVNGDTIRWEHHAEISLDEILGQMTDTFQDLERCLSQKQKG